MQMKFLAAFLALFLVASSQSADFLKCETLYQQWKSSVESLYNDNCLNRTVVEKDVKMAGNAVNCESSKCIDRIVALVAEFKDNFEEMCDMFDFNPEEKDVALVSALQTLPCNKCVVKYSEFTRIKNLANSFNCLPTKTDYACDPKCLEQKIDIIERWTLLIQTQCHMHMPGGCGEGDGPTEGQIYDIVNSMATDIDILRSTISLCNECGSTLGPWYAEWTKLASENCIHSDQIDLTTESPVLASFEIKADCSQECKTKIEGVIHGSYLIDPSCREGLVASHISQLTNSINEHNCGDSNNEAWGFLGSKSAKGFFTLTIVAVGVIASYFLIKCIKGRNSTSKQQSTVWKQGLPSEMKNRDDERGLFDDEEEEDRL